MTSCQIKLAHCREITREEFKILKASGADFQLLDVRQPEEYAKGNLQGILIPLGELNARFNELDAEKLIIIYCQHGVRSQKGAAILLANGFKNVKSLQDGYAFFSK